MLSTIHQQQLSRLTRPTAALMCATLLAPFAARADITWTVGAPSHAGDIFFQGVSPTGVEDAFRAHVEVLKLNGSLTTAEDKAAGIAATIAHFDLPDATLPQDPFFGVSSSGANVVFPNAKSLEITGDQSEETNTLTATLPRFGQVSLSEFFNANPAARPASGSSFSVSVGKGESMTTATTTTDGSLTSSDILAQLDAQLARGNANLAFDVPIHDPLTGDVIGERTPFFDPNTVSIAWDANTGADLANFGLTTASAPEPASLALFGVGLAGLCGMRRRRRTDAAACLPSRDG